MKKLLFLFALLLISSCILTTEELEAEVKASIIETLNDDPEFEGVQVIDLSLIHKGGNEYIGILNVIEPNTVAEAWNTLLQLAELSDKDLLKEDGLEAKYDVEVIYDGESFIWEITKQD
jgi:hypothetical protein